MLRQRRFGLSDNEDETPVGSLLFMAYIDTPHATVFQDR